jgi:hypothetical protein
MKRGAGGLAMVLVLGLSAWAQEAGQQPSPPPEKPTLGAAPAPTLRGPRGGTTANDPRKLARIHTLYIERIDNALSDRLIEGLNKWGRFRIVSQPKEADATLRGSCMEARRLKRVHSEVFISDRSGASVWQDNLFRPYNPPSLDQAVIETAKLVIEHLDQTIREAGQK